MLRCTCTCAFYEGMWVGGDLDPWILNPKLDEVERPLYLQRKKPQCFVSRRVGAAQGRSIGLVWEWKLFLPLSVIEPRFLGNSEKDSNNNPVKVKVKFTLEQATKDQRPQ